MLIQVIVLNLAKVPVIGVEQFQKGHRIAMERKTDAPDGPGFFLFLDPFSYPQAAQLLPGGQIGKHVHQVEIDMVSTQTGQLLLKAALHTCLGFDQVLGQLVRDQNLVATMQSTQGFSQRCLAAAVNISSIKIIDAQFDCFADLFCGGIHIDLSALLGEPHAAIPQDG